MSKDNTNFATTNQAYGEECLLNVISPVKLWTRTSHNVRAAVIFLEYIRESKRYYLPRAFHALVSQQTPVLSTKNTDCFLTSCPHIINYIHSFRILLAISYVAANMLYKFCILSMLSRDRSKNIQKKLIWFWLRKIVHVGIFEMALYTQPRIFPQGKNKVKRYTKQILAFVELYLNVNKASFFFFIDSSSSKRRCCPPVEKKKWTRGAKIITQTGE